ncbi:hypothetical protein AWU67_10260 [Microterricola viridarii]|uniref:Uncharacterized protein n=2 Tax=Microterricola viridarii TaxID=412690 RepID=A0A0X8E3S2_9MICO|nr:hypothetical protein AWU67_10260 [Microterricola viridarii]
MESFKALLADEPISDFDRDRFVGEFRAKIRKAQEGRLRPIENVKGPMREETRLELFEIRWRFEHGADGDLRVRAYHNEPKRLQLVEGSTIVGLHLHKKNVDDDADVDALQDAEIATASDRYFLGRTIDWGLQ